MQLKFWLYLLSRICISGQTNEIENINSASIEDENPLNELITETESNEADSDFEVGDDDIFTANRMRNKQRRHINRKNLNELK